MPSRKATTVVPLPLPVATSDTSYGVGSGTLASPRNVVSAWGGATAGEPAPPPERRFVVTTAARALPEPASASPLTLCAVTGRVVPRALTTAASYTISMLAFVVLLVFLKLGDAGAGAIASGILSVGDMATIAGLFLLSSAIGEPLGKLKVLLEAQARNKVNRAVAANERTASTANMLTLAVRGESVPTPASSGAQVFPLAGIDFGSLNSTDAQMSPLRPRATSVPETVAAANALMIDSSAEQKEIDAAKNKIAEIYRQYVWVSVFFALIAIAAECGAGYATGAITGQDATSMTNFLVRHALFNIFSPFRVADEQVMFAFNKAAWAMSFSLTSLGLALLLGWGLCFGQFGLPQMRESGFAYGAALEPVLTFLIFKMLVLLHKDFKGYPFQKMLMTRPSWPSSETRSESWKTFKAEGQMVVTIVGEQISGLIITLLAASLGQVAVDAQNLLNQAWLVSFIFMFASAQVISIEVSRARGEAHGKWLERKRAGLDGCDRIAYENVSRIFRYGLIASIAVMIVFASAFVVNPAILANLLTDETSPEVFSLAQNLILIVFGSIMADMVRNISRQALSGLGDPDAATYATINSLGGLGAGVITAVVVFFAGGGMYGITAGYFAGLLMAAARLLSRCLKELDPNKLIQDDQLKINRGHRLTDYQAPARQESALTLFNPEATGSRRRGSYREPDASSPGGVSLPAGRYQAEPAEHEGGGITI